MWYLVLVVGFIVAVMPTILFEVWNGASLLGVVLVLLAGGFILRREVMEHD